MTPAQHFSCTFPWLLGLALAQDPAWTPATVAVIKAAIERDRIPGLSCVVAVGEQKPFQQGFGFADIENEVPATPQTVYRLASISKMVTAVAAMQLAEAGKLDLDADVATLVPAWPKKDWPVTTRQLLAHLGGVRHYRDEGESTHHYATQTEALPRFAADPLKHQPGTAYHYSTYGFNLVAAVVEATTKQPFAQVVAERVAGPAGARSLQDDDVRRIVRGRAQGYIRVDGVLQNSALMDASYKLGGGGLCASAEDLAAFGQALLAGKLCSRKSLEAMWTRQQTLAGTEIEYGLGCRVDRSSGRLVVSHSGAQSRVSTMLYLLPEQGVVVVVLCNLEKVRLQPLAQQVAELVAPMAKK
ncbi:MAG: beta-lactamase family protein [Planctomycetes bacterium]|nr:beta-lactamase family protein [Planctomycetota bacterium]